MVFCQKIKKLFQSIKVAEKSFTSTLQYTNSSITYSLLIFYNIFKYISPLIIISIFLIYRQLFCNSRLHKFRICNSCITINYCNVIQNCVHVFIRPHIRRTYNVSGSILYSVRNKCESLLKLFARYFGFKEEATRKVNHYYSHASMKMSSLLLLFHKFQVNLRVMGYFQPYNHPSQHPLFHIMFILIMTIEMSVYYDDDDDDVECKCHLSWMDVRPPPADLWQFPPTPPNIP